MTAQKSRGECKSLEFQSRMQTLRASKISVEPQCKFEVSSEIKEIKTKDCFVFGYSLKYFSFVFIF